MSSKEPGLMETVRHWRTLDSTDLLPCPFCGAAAFSAPSGNVGAIIKCGDCSARTVSDFGREAARTEWNRRSDPK